MSTAINANWDEVFASTADPLPHPVGFVAEDQYGREFMFCCQMGATSSAVGEIAQASTTATRGQVSRTAATSLVGALSTVAWCVGVFQSVLATGQYGWVQISGDGRKALAVTDGSVAAGDPLVIDGGATCVGAVDTMADGEEEALMGVALSADVGTTQAAGTYVIRSIYR